MKVYNVEIFSNAFIYRSSTQISDVGFEIDYLDIVKNKITLPLLEVFAGDYIKISDGITEINGIVKEVKIEKNEIIITYMNFMQICDIDVLVNPTDLTTKTLEGFIADLIKSAYVNNSDVLQNIQGLSVSVMSGTENAILEFDNNIANLYKDIVYNAFLLYSIVIDFKMNFQQKTIECTIKKNISANKSIETRLPNILSKNLELGITRESINKLIVVNEENQAESITYFLHTDNTINSTDTDRILPVVVDTVFVKISGTKTFAEVSLEKAKTTLKANEYDNLIELEVSNDDSLIDATNLSIGQPVTIYDNGTEYHSILTGKKVNKKTVLIFGAVRKELTKKLKWRV